MHEWHKRNPCNPRIHNNDIKNKRWKNKPHNNEPNKHTLNNSKRLILCFNHYGRVSKTISMLSCRFFFLLFSSLLLLVLLFCYWRLSSGHMACNKFPDDQQKQTWNSLSLGAYESHIKQLKYVYGYIENVRNVAIGKCTNQHRIVSDRNADFQTYENMLETYAEMMKLKCRGDAQIFATTNLEKCTVSYTYEKHFMFIINNVRKKKQTNIFQRFSSYSLSLTLFRYGTTYESKLHTEVEISINISNCHVCDIQSHFQLIFFQFFSLCFLHNKSLMYAMNFGLTQLKYQMP